MRVKLVIALAVAIGTCLAANSAFAIPAPPPVQIADFSFQPADVSVEIGGSVSWVNQDSSAHTVTFDSLSIDSGSLASGKTFSATFSTLGQYTYHCSIHPAMTGTVSVVPEQLPPPVEMPRLWVPIVTR